MAKEAKKQTQQQALTAYAILMGMGKKATGEAAFSLFRMKQKLKEIVEFQSEEEAKLVDKLGGKITETGQIIFAGEEEKRAFIEEKKKLGGMEIDPAIEPIRIAPDKIPEINMDEIEALQGFIIFE